MPSSSILSFNMKSFFFTSLLLAAAATAQWDSGDSSDGSYGSGGGDGWSDNAASSSDPAPTSAPAAAGYPAATDSPGNVLVVTSTVRTTKTVQMDDCCGRMATASYSTLGTAATDGSVLLIAMSDVQDFAGNNTVANFASGNGTFSNSTMFSNSTSSSDGDDATVVNAPGTACDGPSEEGADCSGSSGCCGNFSCDPTTLTCTSADPVTLFASNSTTDASGGNSTSSDDTTASLSDNNALNPDDSEQGEAGPDDDGSDDGSDDSSDDASTS